MKFLLSNFVTIIILFTSITFAPPIRLPITISLPSSQTIVPGDRVLIEWKGKMSQQGVVVMLLNSKTLKTEKVVGKFSLLSPFPIRIPLLGKNNSVLTDEKHKRSSNHRPQLPLGG